MDRTDGWTQKGRWTDREKDAGVQKVEGKLYFCLFLLLLLLLSCAHGENSPSQQEGFFHLLLFIVDRQLITKTVKENSF